MAFPQTYAIYPGFNAADGSFVTFAALLSAYTVPYIGVSVTPKSGLVNTFPIRTPTLNGSERGDGMVSLAWATGAIPVTAFQYWITHFFSGGSVTSVPVSIITAEYDTSAVWTRGNAYMQLPIQGGDYTYDSLNMIGWVQRFGDFVPY